MSRYLEVGEAFGHAGVDELRSSAARSAPFEYQGAQTRPRWNFTGGFPDPKYFPTRELLSCLEAAAAEDTAVLQYGSEIDESLRYGEASLRRALLGAVAADLDEPVSIAEVMLTTGAVGAIELAFRAFLDPGDVVVVEAPTWPAALTMASQHRVELVAVELDSAGMRIDRLEERIDELAAEGRRPKLVYTIPTFQTPTGTVMSVERRRRLADLAARVGFVVLEDGTYEALRYDGEPVPSIQSFDTHDRVLKVGSFSKTVAPALRVGWISGREKALTALASVRTDLGVGQWAARALALFVDQGGYAEHLQRLIAGYRQKRDVLHAALERECADLADWSIPPGGYFFWLKLRERVDAGEAKRVAVENGIAMRPGEQFFGLPEDGRQLLRVAFSLVPEEVIPTGVAELGKALRSAAGGSRR
jgi:2-aminoadipate transaminase